MLTQSSVEGEEAPEGFWSLPSNFGQPGLESRCPWATQVGRPGVSPRSGCRRLPLPSAWLRGPHRMTTRRPPDPVQAARPLPCYGATRPSRDLGDSSELPGRWISHPGVEGNDVTGDATSSSNTILSTGPGTPGSCCSCDASASGSTSGWSDGITTTDRTDGVGSGFGMGWLSGWQFVPLAQLN